MNVPRFVFRVPGYLLLLSGLLLVTAAAQQTPSATTASAAQTPTTEALKQLVTREFGASFELMDFPPLFMDVDGDGTEDAVIVATSKNPLLDASELRYKVVDPYDDYFGIGDPKITAGFSPVHIGSPRYLLVLHDWRAATPKAKFVVINLPFEKLSAGRTLRKKKAIPAINAEETGGMISALYWDGKKYKWEPSYVTQ